MQPLTSPTSDSIESLSRQGLEGNSFYEGCARVKSPAAGFGFSVFSSFSFLQAVFALVGPIRS